MNLKQRNILLGLGFILMLWLSYQLSFAKTIQLKKEVNELKKESAIFDNISQKLLKLKQQNTYFDSILKSKKIIVTTSFQNNLLTTINAVADTTQIAIVSFQQPHLFKIDGTATYTYSFTLKGSFHKITQLLYTLEQEYKLGNIVSVHYTKKKNYRRNSEYLECTVLLQHITQE